MIEFNIYNVKENKEIKYIKDIIFPDGDYKKCEYISSKINEYINTQKENIIIIGLFKIEESYEFSWSFKDGITYNELQNTILVDGDFTGKYKSFEQILRLQLENIYHFLQEKTVINYYFNKKNNYINKNILLSKVKENNPIIVKQLLDLFNKSKNTNFSCYFAACKEKEQKIIKEKLEKIKLVNDKLNNDYIEWIKKGECILLPLGWS